MRWCSRVVICAVLAACNTNGPGGDGQSDGGIDMPEDTDTDGTADDDDYDADSGEAPLDLGAADDGATPPEICADAGPEGFDIPTDDTCMTEPAVGVFTPFVEWHKQDWSVSPGSNESVTTPIVVQLTDDNGDFIIDNDDTPDIAYVTYNSEGMLRAIAGDGSAEVLSVPVPSFNRQTGISAADIDADGIVEIIGIGSNGVVMAFEHTGDLKWESVSISSHIVTHDNTAAISDIDGDNIPEIIAGRAILSAAGQLLAAGEHGRGSAGNAGALSFAVDVNDDGDQEVVVGNALYRPDGSAIWHNEEADGFPAVADFDLDTVPEIVVVEGGRVRLQRSTDGVVQWTESIPGGNGGPPTVADFDGDGFPEIGVAGRDSYTVFEGDGTQLWTNVTQDFSSGITGSAVFDFEGDGVADVVYADETRLWVYAGHNGAVKLEFSEHSSGTRIEYPIIADVDGDEQVEIAFVSEQYQSNVRGLTVVGDANGSWQPGRKIWNQHAYYLTNIDDDGTVPAAPTQNWTTYNNFRSGHMGPNDGLAIPGVELFGEACELGCNETGNRIVWIQVGNGGAGELSTEVEVDVFGVDAGGEETLLDTIAFDSGLPAGKVTAGLPVEVDPVAWPEVRARARASETLCNNEPATYELVLTPCPELPPAG